RLRGPQRGQQADRVQGVGDAEFVGGEGRRGAGGARVAEAGQGVGGGGTARRGTVVEEQHQGLEGAAVAGQAEPDGGQVAGPRGGSGRGERGGAGAGAVRRREAVEVRRSARLGR